MQGARRHCPGPVRDTARDMSKLANTERKLSRNWKANTGSFRFSVGRKALYLRKAFQRKTSLIIRPRIMRAQACVCVRTTATEDYRIMGKFQIEPGQGLGVLSCPVIRKPHFAPPIKSKEKRGQDVRVRPLEWKIFPTTCSSIPGFIFAVTDRIFFMTEKN